MATMIEVPELGRSVESNPSQLAPGAPMPQPDLTEAEYQKLLPLYEQKRISLPAGALVAYAKAFKRNGGVMPSMARSQSGGGGGFFESVIGQVGSLIGQKSDGGGAPMPQTIQARSSMSPVLIVGALAAAGGLAWWAFAKPAPKRAANGRRRRRGRRTGR